MQSKAANIFKDLFYEFVNNRLNHALRVVAIAKVVAVVVFLTTISLVRQAERRMLAKGSATPTNSWAYNKSCGCTYWHTQRLCHIQAHTEPHRDCDS